MNKYMEIANENAKKGIEKSKEDLLELLLLIKKGILFQMEITKFY